MRALQAELSSSAAQSLVSTLRAFILRPSVVGTVRPVLLGTIRVLPGYSRVLGYSRGCVTAANRSSSDRLKVHACTQCGPVHPSRFGSSGAPRPHGYPAGTYLPGEYPSTLAMQESPRRDILLIERSKESRRLIANFDEVMRELRYSAAASRDKVRARHCCSSHAIRSQARSGLGRLDDQAREAGAA